MLPHASIWRKGSRVRVRFPHEARGAVIAEAFEGWATQNQTAPRL